jgi:hypothetical protein
MASRNELEYVASVTEQYLTEVHLYWTDWGDCLCLGYYFVPAWLADTSNINKQQKFYSLLE